jgi:hypothetical protein
MDNVSTNTLSSDIPCIRCGYNLRSMAVDSRCPECGSAIADSLVPRPLAHVDRKVLRRIAIGLFLALIAPLLGASACFGSGANPGIALVALFPGGAHGWLLFLLFPHSGAPSWLGAVAISSIAAHLSSSFLITTRRFPILQASSLRRGYRYISIMSLLAIVLIWYLLPDDLPFLGIAVAILADFAQMMLFTACVSSIAIAGTFYDIDLWLGRSTTILLFVIMLAWGLLCNLLSPLIWGVIILAYLLAVFFALGAVGRLGFRLRRIQGLMEN